MLILNLEKENNKMKHITLNKVIDEFNELPMKEKEYAIEIINKRLIEERRTAICKRAKEAKANYKKRKTKSGSAKDLLKDLESD